MNWTRRRQSRVRALWAVPAFAVIAGVALMLGGCGVELFGPGSAQTAAVTLKPGNGPADPETSSVVGAAGYSSAEGQVLVVIGDSISTGYQTSVEDSWPNLLMQDFDRSGVPMTVINAAENGAGFLAPGDEGLTFDAQATSAVPSNADVVLVYGSENDIGEDIPQISSKVEAISAAVRGKSPEAKVVFIGPASYYSDVDPDLIAIRDQIAEGAENSGAEFIDPIAEQWIMGAREDLIGPDGDHPSVQGHVYLAQKFEAIVAPLLGVPVPSP